MITSDRAALRKAFAALLVTALEGAAKPAEKVYDHQVADFGTYNPVVVVTEGGSEWQRFTSQGGIPAGHTLIVHSFVLYATADGAITEAQSEDMLSPIASGVAGVVYTHQVLASTWSGIEWAGSSAIDPIKIRGNEYRHEAIVLRFR
jgi:hypothetical protein